MSNAHQFNKQTNRLSWQIILWNIMVNIRDNKYLQRKIERIINVIWKIHKLAGYATVPSLSSLCLQPMNRIIQDIKIKMKGMNYSLMEQINKNNKFLIIICEMWKTTNSRIIMRA